MPVRGFFTPAETGNAQVMQGRGCVSCGLYDGPLSPVMPPAGQGRLGIMNVGEAPGESEDKRGKPWQGKVGRLLSKTYRRLGVDLFEDCVNVNAVNCRPPKNRDPSSHEVACCWNKVVRPALEAAEPRVIVLLGNAALQSIIGLRWPGSLGGITRWRGFVIPDRERQAWLCPVFHPSFIEREKNAAARTIWEHDLERAIGMADQPLPKHEDDVRRVDIVEGNDQIEGLIRRLHESCDEVAFDYETTGLKPHAEGHRIVSASIATIDPAGEAGAWSFMMPESGPARSAFKKLLRDPDVGLTAHNMKFEDNWSAVRLGVQPRGWAWDSMQAAHVLDNRPGITSLDFQVYTHFGVMDYSSHIKPYLETSSGAGDNAFNRIDELVADPRGRRDLLVYGGLDSLYQVMLAKRQREALR